MQITCEKCHTAYAVDDKLIPPEGAPVQCTKCGNLFTAYPPAPNRGPSRTVMMFSPTVPNSDAPAAPQVIPPSRPTPPVAQPRTAAPTPVPQGVTNLQQRRAPESFSGFQPDPSVLHSALGKPEPSLSSPAHLAESLADQPREAGAPQAEPPHERPSKLSQLFFNEGGVVDEENAHATRLATGEIHRRPGQTQMFRQAAELEEQLTQKSRMPFYLALGGLGVLALATALVLPGLLGPPGADRRAVQDHARALELVRKDDPASLAAADRILADILTRKGRYVAAEADRALVQQFLADDRLIEVDRLRAQYDALGRHVQQLSSRSDAADVAQRSNDLEAMKRIRVQYDSLTKESEGLESEALAISGKAAKDDSRDPAQLRARAFIAADHDNGDQLQHAQQAYLHEIGQAKDGWSELMLAELTTAGKPSAQKRMDGQRALDDALALDPGLIRARYLRVRLDVAAKDEAAAKRDVDALKAANPAHTEGDALLAGLQEELGREKAAQAEREARQAALAKPVAAKAPPKNKRKAPYRKLPRRSR